MTEVLLVDDDQHVREVLCKMLTILGCWVETAKDGLDALEHFRDHPQRIDLVVTDLQMPNLNGYELVCRIRQLNPEMRFICMSGSDSVRCPPGVGFLSKPFSLADVQESVSRAMPDFRKCSPAHH